MTSISAALTATDEVRDILSSEIELAGVASITIFDETTHELFRGVVGLTDARRATLLATLAELASDAVVATARVDVFGPNGEMQRREVLLDRDRYVRLWDLAHEPIGGAKEA
jgi:hypothetical protein